MVSGERLPGLCPGRCDATQLSVSRSGALFIPSYTGLHIGAIDAIDNVLFEDLEEIRTIGAGASSTVKLARHNTTGVYYALKCIGLYMKDMRKMLLTELHTLFHSDCDALIAFHGATYREGQVRCSPSNSPRMPHSRTPRPRRSQLCWST